MKLVKFTSVLGFTAIFGTVVVGGCSSSGSGGGAGNTGTAGTGATAGTGGKAGSAGGGGTVGSGGTAGTGATAGAADGGAGTVGTGGGAAGNTVVTLPDPDGWWKLNEGTGTVINDSSANHNNGVAVAGGLPQTITPAFLPAPNPSPTWAAGRKTGTMALHFNGTTEWVNIPPAATFDIPADSSYEVTLTGWANIEAVTTGMTNAFNWIIARDVKGTSYDVWGLAAHGGKPSSSVYNAFCDGPTVATLNTWTFFAMTFTQDTTQTTYVNGDQVCVFDPNNNPSNVTISSVKLDPTAVTIGANQNGDHVNENFNGTIEDVRLYTSALSAAQIKLLYDTTK